jgi:hypothetical protein
MQLLRGLPWSVGSYARAGNGGVLADSAVFLSVAQLALRWQRYPNVGLR